MNAGLLEAVSVALWRKEGRKEGRWQVGRTDSFCCPDGVQTRVTHSLAGHRQSKSKSAKNESERESGAFCKDAAAGQVNSCSWAENQGEREIRRERESGGRESIPSSLPRDIDAE